MTPSINRMIRLLSEEERQHVTKPLVIQMESEIVRALNFDMNFLSPLTFLERFLRLSDLQEDFKMNTIAEELCRLAMSKVEFLDYKPSQIAAAAYIIANNLSSSSTKESVKLSTNCWNEFLQKHSGYSKTDVQKAFLEMQAFINLNNNANECI